MLRQRRVYAHVSQVEQLSAGIAACFCLEQNSTSFCDACQQLGKIALTLELSASRVITGEDVERGFRVLQRYFGMLPKAQQLESGRFVDNSSAGCPGGGVLAWHRQRRTIQQGEPLATLYTRQGKQELPHLSGLLLLKNPTHAPHERQELAKFLLE